MKVPRLRAISKLFLSLDDVARVLRISRDSAKVFCSRHVKSGELLRLKRGWYILRERWEHLTPQERFQVGNLLQVPSYISLMTVLSHDEVTTQVQQGFVESVAIYRTKEVRIGQVLFRYAKVAPPLYFGFVKQDGYFIATPEKAFVDCLYLASLHRYHIDWASVALQRLRRQEIQQMLKRYPVTTRKLWSARWTS